MRGLYNGYCDYVKATLYNFMDNEEVEEFCENYSFTEEELELMCRFMALKNISSGVSEVNFASPSPQVTKKIYDEFGLGGQTVLKECYLDKLETKDFIGGKIIIEIPSLIDLKEARLCEISDLSAKLDFPLLIHFGKSLEEVGLISTKYNHSPAEFIEELGFLDRKCMLLGCNYIDKDDLEKISAYDGQVLLSPQSDCIEAKGFVNLLTIQNQGLKYSLASGVNPNINIFSEAKLLWGQTSQLLLDNKVVNFACLENALQSEDGELNLLQSEFNSKIRKFDVEQADIISLTRGDKILKNKGKSLGDEIKKLENKIYEMLRSKKWK